MANRMRCEDCGETWWSALGVAQLGACELCGGRLVEERRFPGRGAPGSANDERRDAPVVREAADG